MKHDLPVVELTELYGQGLSTIEIAKRYGVSPQTVNRRLRIAGVTVSKVVPTPTIEEIVARYEDGWPLSDLAAWSGVSPQTMGRRLTAAGVHLRGKSKSTVSRSRLSRSKRRFDVPMDQVQALREQGYSTQDMADSLGIPSEVIRERMVEARIERLPAKARQDRNHFWAGGFHVDKHGYILVKMNDHPHCTKAGYVRQHRLVMEEHLGRYLNPVEVVDHANGDTSDNRIENLRLFPDNAAHLAATLEGTTNLSPEEREAQRLENVQRAKTRVAAILAESRTDAPPSLQ